MTRKIALSALLLFPLLLAAQLPNTDVWLFTYRMDRGSYLFTGGQNISNHTGYDNQPSFSSNGSYMLWTSQRDSNETDIMRYDLGNRTSVRITQTPFSEYSPVYMEGNKFISAIVVEKDSVQRLWKYNKLNGQGKVLLPKFFGAGYYCWFDARRVFLFQVTNPATLVLAETGSGVTKICAGNVGRCMQIYRTPKQKMLLYTQESDSSGLWIKALNGNGEKEADFAPVKALEGSQDFVVDKWGNLLMAKGSKLYSWTIGSSTAWTEIADFAGNGLHDISRITLSPDGSHIAFVNTND